MSWFQILVMAMLDLAKAIFRFPVDWSDEKQVQEWLRGMEEHLALIITMLLPDEEVEPAVKAPGRSKVCCEYTTRFNGATLEYFRGKTSDGIDFDQIIDWVADLLCTWWPSRCALIKIIASLAKQIFKWLADEERKVPVEAKLG